MLLSQERVTLAGVLSGVAARREVLPSDPGCRQTCPPLCGSRDGCSTTPGLQRVSEPRHELWRQPGARRQDACLHANQRAPPSATPVTHTPKPLLPSPV